MQMKFIKDYQFAFFWAVSNRGKKVVNALSDEIFGGN